MAKLDMRVSQIPLMAVRTRPGELEEKPTAYGSRTEKKQEGLRPLEEQTKQEEHSLLMELFHFESEVLERTRKQWDHQKEQAKLQKEENRDRWRNLCYITQNQRFSKPWVSSYFKNIPMYIYCQPIVRASQRVKNRKMKGQGNDGKK